MAKIDASYLPIMPDRMWEWVELIETSHDDQLEEILEDMSLSHGPAIANALRLVVNMRSTANMVAASPDRAWQSRATDLIVMAEDLVSRVCGDDTPMKKRLLFKVIEGGPDDGCIF